MKKCHTSIQAALTPVTNLRYLWKTNYQRKWGKYLICCLFFINIHAHVPVCVCARVCVCLCVCMCVCARTRARMCVYISGAQKRKSDPLELGFQVVVRCPTMLLLGTAVLSANEPFPQSSCACSWKESEECKPSSSRRYKNAVVFYKQGKHNGLWILVSFLIDKMMNVEREVLWWRTVFTAINIQ